MPKNAIPVLRDVQTLVCLFNSEMYKHAHHDRSSRLYEHCGSFPAQRSDVDLRAVHAERPLAISLYDVSTSLLSIIPFQP
jgi:hypothetical protein